MGKLLEELNAIPSPNGASDRPPFSQQQSNQKATPAIFKIQQVISKILEQFDESFAQFIWLGEQFPGGSDSKESAYNAGVQFSSVSRVQLFATPWTEAYQASLFNPWVGKIPWRRE